jgi:hypothetical protein
MLKKTIKYTDFDNNERTEDFYFNLTKAEVTEMELSTEGGLVRMLEKIVQEKDAKRIIENFKDLVLRSYGEKSPDGRRFIKTQELRDAFAQTEAYSQLFMELATNAQASAEFVNGIVPQVPNK